MITRKKILLVDSCKAQSSKNQSILEKEGYVVEAVVNGIKAIDYLKTETDLPDVIITDIFMPVVDGFELCVEVKKTFPKIPVIILTIHNDDKNLQKAFESGASDYLAKPYTKTELILRLANVLLMCDSEKMLTTILNELRSKQKELEDQNKAFRDVQLESARVQSAFSNVFNNSDDAMLIISGNNFIDCNEATVKLLNAKNKNDVYSTHPSKLSPPVQPDGRKSFEKANEMMDIAYNKGVHRFEWMHKKLTGEVFPVEVTLIPIKYQNELVLHTLWKDLTEHKNIQKNLLQSKERFKDISLSTNGLLWEVNSDFQFTYCSENVKDILGYSPNELMGKTPFVLMSQKKTGKVDKIIKEYFTQRKPLVDLESWHIAKDGKNICFLINGSPAFDENGSFLGYHGVNKDITKRKKIEKALAKKEEQLEEANKKLTQSNNKLEIAIQAIRKKAKAVENSAKLKSSFLSTMSHEIRTPLNAIMGSILLLKESDSPEDKKQYTDIIETSGNLLLGLINNVLDYSRIEAHKLKILSNEFYLDYTISGLNEILKKSAQDKKLKFNVQTEHDLSEKLIGDDIRLQQILLNLCNNAIKYTKKGSVVLKIETLKETGSDVNFQFSVIDTGIGISEEDMKQLFKPFSQFDPEINKDIEGTGLGLSIVKGTVDLMGGEVGVESKLGIGSTFWVDLKFRKQTVNVKEKRRDTSKRDSFNFEKSKLKILIADDYTFSSIILEKNLQKSYITSIDKAENGRKAVDLFKVNDYDIIFMDCNMPVMNGFEATREIRKLKKKTYIVALSADVMSENEKACINAGMDYFIEKPFKAVKIENIIRKIILTKINAKG